MRLFFVPFLVLMMLFSPLGGFFSLVIKVSAAVDDPTLYPYGPNGNGVSSSCTLSDGTVAQCDPWGFVIKNCTSYVAYRVNLNKRYPYLKTQTWYPFKNSLTDYQVTLGNGHQWDDAVNYAMTIGTSYYVDNVPAVGAVAQWEKGSKTGDSKIGDYGHVAYVEKVNTDGSVVVSEYNYPTAEKYNLRTTRADHYIHFNSPNDGMTGSLSGIVRNPNGTLNTKPTLITFTVKSDISNNKDFYYLKSYFGAYRFNRLPPNGTIRATDGTNWTTIDDVSVFPDIPDAIYTPSSKIITLDNTCHSTELSMCGQIPFISNVTWGGQYVLPGANGSVGGMGGAAGNVCTTPPLTNSNVSGATQGNNGWWRSAASVSFYASAPCGLDGLKTYYTINGGSQQTYSGPFTLNQEGVYNINFYSVDGAGNVEGSKSTQVKIDWTPPVTTGTATGPRDTNGIFRDTVTAGLNATDNLSGVESNQYTLDGTTWTNKTGNNNTFQITGNGVSRFMFRSIDIAGNTENQKDSGPIIINKYIVFSNATSTSLRFKNMTNSVINGEMYSGGTASFSGNTGSTLGTTLTMVGSTNTMSGNTGVTLPTLKPNSPSVPMLSYPLSLYQSLATVVFPADLTMESVGATYKGIFYVQGNVDMYDVALSGPLSIVATGTITDWTTDSTYQSGDPNNGVLLYAGKDIVVNSTGNRNLGLMYAPAGTIYMKSTNLNLKGSLVGNQIEFTATTGLNLSYSAAFNANTYTLPLTAMVLAVDKPTPPALPSVATLSKPANAATGISNTRPKLSWNASTGAVGYQAQVSTSATFDTLAFNGSMFSTGAASINLQKATKYYWRVRSINQAGMSAWSAVRYFTTQ